MPPIAPRAGRAILLFSASSPTRSSRFSSRPTRKKNTAIKPSLTQSSSGLAISNGPMRTCTGSSTKYLYSAARGELAAIIASSIAPTSRMPPADSDWMNSRQCR